MQHGSGQINIQGSRMRWEPEARPKLEEGVVVSSREWTMLVEDTERRREALTKKTYHDMYDTGKWTQCSLG